MRVAIVLAAGSSRRFGRGDKLLARLGRRTVLEHAVARAAAMASGRLLVVVPSFGGRVGRALAGSGAVRIVARDHARGMGASLRAGLRTVRPIEREVIIFLGDMPFAGAPRHLRLRPGRQAARPVFAGRPGHPVLVRTRAARDVRIRPDEAGLLARVDRAQVAMVPGGRGNVLDIDTGRMLRQARRALANAVIQSRGSECRPIRPR